MRRPVLRAATALALAVGLAGGPAEAASDPSVIPAGCTISERPNGRTFEACLTSPIDHPKLRDC